MIVLEHVGDPPTPPLSPPRNPKAIKSGGTYKPHQNLTLT